MSEIVGLVSEDGLTWRAPRDGDATDPRLFRQTLDGKLLIPAGHAQILADLLT